MAPFSIDPPADVLAKIQSILIDFFWDKLHWVQKSVLYLSKEEGGLGLINLQSRRLLFAFSISKDFYHLLWSQVGRVLPVQFSGTLKV